MGKFGNELVLDIKEMTGYDVEKLMEIGLLKVSEARKWVVKEKYYSIAKETGRSYADIKYDLSELYGMSVSSIEKMIYRK